MPNHVLVPTSEHEIREEVQQQNLLNRQFLFTKKDDNEPLKEIRNLYIKWEDKLWPIGGSLKQNKLIAGDNIEINPLDTIPDQDQQEEVRLKDDIYINTCTLTPSSEVLPWKGMVKIGEIENADFLILMKGSSFNEPNATIGGELLVKVEDDTGMVRYLHYDMSLTSTGSWSLRGASHVPGYLKIGSIVHRDHGTQYYGLILPKEYAEFTTVEIPIYDITDLSAYMGIMLGEDEDELYIYNTVTKYNELIKELHIQDYGLEEDDGYSRDIWTVKVKDLDKALKWTKNNPKMSEANAIAPWLEWTNKGYKIGFTFDTKNEVFRPWEVYNTSSTICLKKTGLEPGAEGMQPYATYALTRDELAYTLEDWGADSMATYNVHWYVIAVPLFLRLCGFTPIGDWKTYNTYGLVLGLRIATVGTATKVVRLGILNSVTREPIKIIETSDTDTEFGWESDLTSTDNEKYVEMENEDIERFCRFTDRELGAEKRGLRIRGIDVHLLDDDVNILTEGVDFEQFNQLFVENNFTFVSNLTNNKTPIFTDNEDTTPRLTYSGQGEFSSDGCTSLLGVLNTTYKNLLRYETEIQRLVKKFNIRHAEFWFNGWQDIPKTLLPPEIVVPKEYNVAAVPNKVADVCYYAHTKYYTMADFLDPGKGIDSLQKLGEDKAPYHIIILEDWLSANHLKKMAQKLQVYDRQVYLDLSNCRLEDAVTKWDSSLFEGCVSLQEISVPKNLADMDRDVFKWCTYLKRVDLTTTQNTLHTIGASKWEQNSGFLVSTKVHHLLIPKSVSLLRDYLVYSSNIKSLIFLHDKSIGFIEDYSYVPASKREGTLSCTEWTWVGQKPDLTNIYTLPDDFHIYFSKSFWEEGTSRGNRFGQPNKNGTGYDWYPNYPEIIRWNKNAIDSIVIYPQDGTKEEWQAFHDMYGWSESLINEVRAQFGHTDWIEII